MRLLAIIGLLILASPAAAQEDPEAGLVEGRLVGDPSPAPAELVRPQLRPSASAATAIIGGVSVAAGGLALVASWSLYVARQNFRQQPVSRLTAARVDEFVSMGAWSFGLGIGASALLITSEVLLLPESRDVPTIAWIAGGAGVVLAAVGIGFTVGGEHCGPQEVRPGATLRLSCTAGTADSLFGSLILLSSAPLLAIPATYLLRKAFAGAPDSLSLTPGGVQLSGRF